MIAQQISKLARDLRTQLLKRRNLLLIKCFQILIQDLTTWSMSGDIKMVSIRYSSTKQGITLDYDLLCCLLSGAAPPVRLVRFSPDHFLLRFIMHLSLLHPTHPTSGRGGNLQELLDKFPTPGDDFML